MILGTSRAVKVWARPGPTDLRKGCNGLFGLVQSELDHLPLTRQARIMKRHGLVVNSQTPWDPLHALAKRLRAHWEAVLAHVLRQPVIGLDQTSWKRLDKKRKETP